MNPGLTQQRRENCGGHSKSHFGTCTSFLTQKFQFTQELKNLSATYNCHEALDREKSIFDMLILFLARTIFHQENTNHLYPKLPLPLHIKTKHHPAQKIHTRISNYQCQKQWGNQYLPSLQFLCDNCWKAAIEIKTD